MDIESRPAVASATFSQAFGFWRVWLIVANGVGLLIGLLLVFFGDSFIFAPHHSGTAETFFAPPHTMGPAEEMKLWLLGIIGATMAGYHLVSLMIIKFCFKAKALWAWRTVSASLLLWFMLDSLVSLQFEAFHNILLVNLPTLFVLGFPLLMTRRYFGSVVK